MSWTRRDIIYSIQQFNKKDINKYQKVCGYSKYKKAQLQQMAMKHIHLKLVKAPPRPKRKPKAKKIVAKKYTGPVTQSKIMLRRRAKLRPQMTKSQVTGKTSALKIEQAKLVQAQKKYKKIIKKKKIVQRKPKTKKLHWSTRVKAYRKINGGTIANAKKQLGIGK